MQEYKIHNADILFKEDSSVDDLIDVIEVRRCMLWNTHIERMAVSDLLTVQSSLLPLPH